MATVTVEELCADRVADKLKEKDVFKMTRID